MLSSYFVVADIFLVKSALETRLPNICLQVRKSEHEVRCQHAAEQGTAITPTVKQPQKKSLNDDDDSKRSLTVY